MALIGSRYIDALASLRQGHAVPADRRDANVASSLYGRAMQIARNTVSERADSADTGKFFLERFDAAVDKLTADSFCRRSLRHDAITESGGALLATQLRYVQEEVLKEPHPLPSALSLFPSNTSVPLGARTFAVRRYYDAGEARVHRGGSGDIPTVSLAQAEMEFQIRNYVTSAVWDVFEEMSASFASLDYAVELARIARDVLERFANEMTWYGDEAHKIYGVLNYPWLDKEVSSTTFGGNPDNTVAHLQALNGWINRQHHASKGTLGPNKMVTSPRVSDWIMQTGLQASTTSLRDRTIGEVLLASSRLNGAIEQAHELENVMGDGVDAILFYRDDAMGIENVLPGGGIRTLPLHQTDIDRRQVFFMPHGGVRMLEVGNNLLVFVSYSG